MEKLTADQKKTVSTQIKTLNPKGEIVSLAPGNDFKGGSIFYNKESGILLGEGGFRLTDEEYVRAWLVVRLVKVFRYPADSIELEHTYAAGRPSPTRAQVDIRIHDKRGKKPGVSTAPAKAPSARAVCGIAKNPPSPATSRCVCVSTAASTHVSPGSFSSRSCFRRKSPARRGGIGNMTNIFPPEVERMLVVTCKTSQQDALVREITAELDHRTNALASIESKRAEITKLIDNAIRAS